MEQTALVEGAEAEFMYRYESSAPPSVRTRLGINLDLAARRHRPADVIARPRAAVSPA
ncbi:hypothetical protein AB0F88_22960 [Streptosporangium sp. NPDC023963]|uniref:hypothetical protein n=1 Tax=Streptosporangium sp. NPDC023963 TaxID=3155608 RepID=UPI00343BF473